MLERSGLVFSLCSLPLLLDQPLLLDMTVPLKLQRQASLAGKKHLSQFYPQIIIKKIQDNEDHLDVPVHTL